MKRTLAVVLVLSMALCLMLAGCGSDSGNAFDDLLAGLPQGDVMGNGQVAVPDVQQPEISVTLPESFVPDVQVTYPDATEGVDEPEWEVPTTAPTQTIPLPTLPTQSEPEWDVPATEPEWDEPSWDEPSWDEPSWDVPGETEAVSPEANYYLNDNNNYYNDNAIAVNPRYVYWDGQNLVAEVFVVNGYNYTVTGIMLDHFELSVDGTLIAAANFGELPDVNIPAYCYQIYTLTFAPGDITYPNADLWDLGWYYEVRSRG